MMVNLTAPEVLSILDLLKFSNRISDNFLIPSGLIAGFIVLTITWSRRYKITKASLGSSFTFFVVSLLFSAGGLVGTKTLLGFLSLTALMGLIVFVRRGGLR